MEKAVLVRLIRGEGVADFWRLRVGELSGGGAAGIPEVFVKEIERFSRGDERVTFIRQRVGDIDCKMVLERVTDRRSLLVFGAGHVGRSVALMGAMLGMDVCLIDDREDFLRGDAVPAQGIQVLCVGFEAIGDAVWMDEMSSVVIVTRGHQYDEVILKQLAGRRAGYIGMIGSRRRVEGIFRRLRVEGVEESFLRNVKAPIGLDIGAASPQEIAVSIHAEIINCFNNRRASDNDSSSILKEQGSGKVG